MVRGTVTTVLVLTTGSWIADINKALRVMVVNAPDRRLELGVYNGLNSLEACMSTQTGRHAQHRQTNIPAHTQAYIHTGIQTESDRVDTIGMIGR